MPPPARPGAPPAVFARALRRARRIAISTHVHPDPDAIGSELALLHILESPECEVVVINEDPPPRYLSFLPGISRILAATPPPPGPFDTFLAVDAPDAHRLGTAAAILRRARSVLNLDHHHTNSGFGRHRWVDPSASSVGEMVLRLMTPLGARLTPEIATCLFAAVLTDTGRFTNANTSPESLDAAARLVAAGADPHVIACRIYRNIPLGHLRLTARVALNTRVKNRVAWSFLRLADFRREKADPRDLMDLVDIPRMLAGIDAAVFFCEIASGLFKVSFRSLSGRDVSVSARRFGGGGHRLAAGCQIRGALPNTVRRVITALGGPS
ncbi:MAG: DHH family phosphoesterase [Planctomycetota bacterium]